MRECDPLTQGNNLINFENKFKEYIGAEHAFAVANCTNALDIAAVLSKIGPDDEVIMPAHTFCATAIPFARTGAVIKWADIDKDTRAISTETIKPLISEKTKAIVVVHLYGLMAQMPEIMELADQYNILVVEDCAQAIGADIAGRKAGTYGDYACFSFHGAKNMSTLGEGGMLVVKSGQDAELVPGLRHNGCCGFQGERECYWKPAMSNVDVDIPGVWPYNFSLGEMQCAVGAALIERIDEMSFERIRRANKFISAMADYPELSFQKPPHHYKHVYHLLSARYDGHIYGKNRDDFIQKIWHEYGVRAIVQYYPLYRYPLFKSHGFGEADCPNTDYFFDNMVSFPFHLWMSEDDFDYMIDATLKTLEALRK
jgi:dTDP-4-amino-4,6-dideoxygalactose transaminase